MRLPYNFERWAVMNSIAKSLEAVREQIAQAAAKAGRAPDEIELVAISKTHDAECVREAHEAGQQIFGEILRTVVDCRDSRSTTG